MIFILFLQQILEVSTKLPTKTNFSNKTFPSHAIPSFGNRARDALSCVGGKMRAAMGATGECNASPHTQYSMCFETYWFLPVISSVVIACTFSTDDDHLQKSTILSSVICRYTSHQRPWHQPKFDQFCPKKLPWNHMEVLRYKAAIPGLYSQYIPYHLKCNFT